MKKRVVAAMMTMAMAAALLAGCGGGSGSTASSAASSASGSGDASGKVYMLNFKPEIDQQWQDLAAAYTQETGVPVTVVTAASGTYDTTLTSEMAKSEMPTVYNIGNTAAAQQWDDYALDLKDTELYSHVPEGFKNLAVEYNGKVSAIANCYECYGLIYNKTILEGYCGLDGAVVSSVDEINSLDVLEQVADDINSRIDEINEALGTELTEAFASAGLDDGSSWRFSGHLANMPLYYEFADAGADLLAGQATVEGKYLDNFKRVWDMYVRDSAADPKTLDNGTYNAEQEFGMGEAVFFQNGDWEFAGLTDEANGYTVTADDLAMMPIYFGVDDANEGLCVGTENHWAVNAKAPQEDIDATLAFLNWVITSDAGRDAMANQMGLVVPFDTFTGDYEGSNVLAACASQYVADGRTSISWSFNATPNVDTWRKGVVTALTAYTAGSGDWDAVVTAFTEGWATEWQNVQEAQ